MNLCFMGAFTKESAFSNFGDDDYVKIYKII